MYSVCGGGSMYISGVSPEGQGQWLPMELELQACVGLWVLKPKFESSVGLVCLGIFVHCVKRYLLCMV